MLFKCLKFWHKRHDGPSNSPAVSTQTGNGAVQPSRIATPNQAPTSHTQSSMYHDNLSATPSSYSSSARYLERLWNEAYDGLKANEGRTVEAYEKLLVERIKELNKHTTSLVASQVIPSMLKHPDQMKWFVTAGMEKSEEIATSKKNLEAFSKIARPVKTVMDFVVQAAPQAALAWSCISFTLQILANPLTESSINREGIDYVLSTMGWYRSLVDVLVDDDHQSDELRNELEKNIVELYRRLLHYQMKSVCSYYRKQVYVFFRDVVKFDDWSGELIAVKEAEQNVRDKLGQYQDSSIGSTLKELARNMRSQLDNVASAVQEQSQSQQALQEQLDRENCLRHFHETTIDPHDARERIQNDKGGLLRDSYSWILDHICFQKWYEDDVHKVLWVTGNPGKGKTMLLCGIIDELEKEPTNMVSYFFCQATQATLNSATAVLRGLIYGLAKRYRCLDRHVHDRYKGGGGKAVFEGQSAWVVLCGIMKAMLDDPVMDGLLIIVDALDECEQGRRELLDFICERSLHSRAKWLVSSRNWLEIEKAMEKVTTQTLALSLELNDYAVADAVGKYIQQKVDEPAERSPFKDNQELCDKVTGYLQNNSGNTFLWVALACDALREDRVLLPEHVYDEMIQGELPRGLEELYDRMLQYISASGDANICKYVLAVALVLKRHVTVRELRSIMESSTRFNGNGENVEYFVRRCGAFLNIRDGFVYFVHQSAREFLHKKQDAFSPVFPRGIAIVHQEVCLSSLKAISKILRRDIFDLRKVYGLQAFGLLRDDITPPQPDPLASVKYACVHWIDHLSKSDFTSHIEEHGVIHKFLKDNFLYWIEALVLLRELPQAIRAIQELQQLVVSQTWIAAQSYLLQLLNRAQDRQAGLVKQSLSDFIHDANRFLLYHRVMVENTPLQIYSSALMFSPEQSIVKKQFWREAPDWVTVTQGVDEKWDTCLQTLFGHKSSVNSLAYSPDGQWLVSGDDHGTVKLWDVDRGACVHTLDYHEENPVEYREFSTRIGRTSVKSVAFSPDGQFFTSAYASGLCKAFDTVRGDCIREFSALAHSEDTIDTFANRTVISKDSHTMACSLGGKSISILEMDTGAPRRTFRPHSNEVHAISLTADGHFLASADEKRGTIEIWDTLRETSKSIITTDEVQLNLLFSADGRWLATSSFFYPIRVWESTTGQLSLTLKHDMKDSEYLEVCSMAFSDDNNLIAASYGSQICIWNTTTTTLVWKSEECGWDIGSLVFSPDAQRLVSGSHYKTIKVWDLPKTVDDTSDSRLTRGLCYSNGLHFATYYPALQEIEIWTGATETDLTVNKCHQNNFCVMSLSPDHRSLASASEKGKIIVWDTETGNQKQTFGEHRGRNSDIKSLVFRGNSQLASGGFGTIDIWDTSDGRHKRRYKEKGKYIRRMTFSTGGQWLAYEPADSGHVMTDKVMVRDTATERCFPVSIGTQIVMSFDTFRFSADSQLLVLAISPNIYLWDVRSRACTRAIRGYWGFRNIQISFDANVQRRLHTQYGFLDLDDQDPNFMNAGHSDTNNVNSEDSEDDLEVVLGRFSQGSSSLLSGYGFSHDLKWVTKDQRRLFQIPFDYQANNLSEMTPVIDGSTFVWISKSGRLLRMHFNV